MLPMELKTFSIILRVNIEIFACLLMPKFKVLGLRERRRIDADVAIT